MMQFFPLFCLLIVAGSVQAQERTVTAADRSHLSVTVYGNGLAHVRDRRTVDLPAGISSVVFSDVGAMLDPTSTVVDSDTAVHVLEQSFQREVISEQTLLQRSIGKQVRIVRTHPTTGADITEEATVLAVDGGLVLRIGNRIETGTPGRIVFNSIPADLRSQPTLVLRLSPQAAGPKPITLSYLTGGLSWRADYAAFLDSGTMRFEGRASLSNESGTAFRNAAVQLVAGDVHRVSSQPAAMPKVSRTMALGSDAANIVPDALGEQHLYALPGQVDLAERENKQVSLVNLAKAAIVREYVSEGYVGPSPQYGLPAQSHADMRISFRNSLADGLGMPMPGGVFRAYERDASGTPRFIGEDNIGHTPVDGKVTLSLGGAFDVTVQRSQTEFRILGKPVQSFESAQRIEIRNARNESVTVSVMETIGGDWTIGEESHPHRTTSSGMAEWQIPVPAGGRSLLTYKAKVQLAR